MAEEQRVYPALEGVHWAMATNRVLSLPDSECTTAASLAQIHYARRKQI